MKRFMAIATVLISTSLFSMEVKHKPYIIVKNFLPDYDKKIKDTRIDISTTGENIVDYYPKKKYIHSLAEVTTSIISNKDVETKIFLHPKTAKDQLGLSETGNTAVINLYIPYLQKNPIRLRVYRKPNQSYLATTVECYIHKYRPYLDLHKQLNSVAGNKLVPKERYLFIYSGEIVNIYHYPSMKKIFPVKYKGF